MYLFLLTLGKLCTKSVYFDSYRFQLKKRTDRKYSELQDFDIPISKLS